MSGATETRQESLWPPVEVVRDTVLVLAALVLIVLLADGELVLWLSGATVIVWMIQGVRRDLAAPDDAPETPLWARLLPIFTAIVVADLLVGDKWFPMVVIAIGAPLLTLARVGLVLHRRRSA